MSDEPEQFPDPIAELDQMLRGLVDMAKALRGYYLALVEQGFSEEQALALTMAFQTQIQRGAAEQ